MILFIWTAHHTRPIASPRWHVIANWIALPPTPQNPSTIRSQWHLLAMWEAIFSGVAENQPSTRHRETYTDHLPIVSDETCTMVIGGVLSLITGWGSKLSSVTYVHLDTEIVQGEDPVALHPVLHHVFIASHILRHRRPLRGLLLLFLLGWFCLGRQRVEQAVVESCIIFKLFLWLVHFSAREQ